MFLKKLNISCVIMIFSFESQKIIITNWSKKVKCILFWKVCYFSVAAALQWDRLRTQGEMLPASFLWPESYHLVRVADQLLSDNLLSFLAIYQNLPETPKERELTIVKNLNYLVATYTECHFFNWYSVESENIQRCDQNKF